jgi:hypothetical protein
VARHKDADWNLPERLATYDQVEVAVLMDIRDELKRLNRTLSCPNFQRIPYKLDAIAGNTRKPKRRKTKGKR